MRGEKVIICVGCPLGCEITLTLNDNGEVSKVSGNSCQEGKAYALEEYMNPVRADGDRSHRKQHPTPVAG